MSEDVTSNSLRNERAKLSSSNVDLFANEDNLLIHFVQFVLIRVSIILQLIDLLGNILM